MLQRLLFLCAAVAPPASLLAPSDVAGQEGEIPDSLRVTVVDETVSITRPLLVILVPDAPLETDSTVMRRWRTVRDSLIRAHLPVVARYRIALTARERWHARLADPQANAIYEPPEVSIGYVFAAPFRRPQLIVGYLPPEQLRDILESYFGHP